VHMIMWEGRIGGEYYPCKERQDVTGWVILEHFVRFLFMVQLLAVVYKIYSKDSSCKRDEKCNKSVRKRYTETEKWWKHFAVCFPFDSLLEKSVSKCEKIGVLGRTLRFAL